MYKLTYIDHLKGIGNCFSSYGTHVHSIMERYAKGEIELWDLVKTYELEFDEAIPEDFPNSKFCPDMRELYFRQGRSFLSNFEGYDGRKILGVEEQFDMDIDDWEFTGVIDLVFEDEKGRLIVQDYKSKSSFKSKKEQAEYARQLYLYSLYIKQKYGRYPDILRFSMFRKENEIDIPFSESSLDEALCWARDVVSKIRDCWEFEPNCEDFFANHLCNHREYCENKI